VIDSSAKGGRFEREISRALSLWMSSGIDGDLLWRSSASGARATRRGDQSLSHAAGDIAAAKPGGWVFIKRFYVECKHYKDLQIPQFVSHGKSRLGNFWTVARQAALSYHRRPLLVARQNRLSTLIVMEPDTWEDFAMQPHWSLANHEVVIGLFEEFVAYADFEFCTRRRRLASKRQAP
jgi:hypothetical protein